MNYPDVPQRLMPLYCIDTLRKQQVSDLEAMIVPPLLKRFVIKSGP